MKNKSATLLPRCGLCIALMFLCCMVTVAQASVKYAADMPAYVRNVKSLERWVGTNLNTPKPETDALLCLE